MACTGSAVRIKKHQLLLISAVWETEQAVLCKLLASNNIQGGFPVSSKALNAPLGVGRI